MIAVSGPDQVELPQELREKLEQKAQELVERLRERLEQAEADGVEPELVLPEDAMEAHRQQIDAMRTAMKKLGRDKEALKQDFLTEVRGAIAAGQGDLFRYPMTMRFL